MEELMLKKRISSIIFLLLCFAVLIAEQKKPLVEIFTSSTCPPCVGVNSYMDSLLDLREGAYSLIKYQMNYPESGDPYYITECGQRRQYYDVSGVPSVFVNSVKLTGTFDITDLDAEIAKTTELKLELTANVNQDSIVTVSAHIIPQKNFNEGLTFQMHIVEETTTGNSSTNGERYFSNVLMKAYPDANGGVLSALEINKEVIINNTIDLKNTNIESVHNLSLVAFVQDPSSKEIVQSEMVAIGHFLTTFDIIINMKDSLNNPLADAIVELEGLGRKRSDNLGKVIYNNILPDTYVCKAQKSGHFKLIKELCIDKDTDLDIVLKNPYLFSESFTNKIINPPIGWKPIRVAPMDFIYTPEVDGALVFLSQTEQPMGVVSPEIDFSKVDSLYFSFGKEFGLALNKELTVGVSASQDTTDYTLVAKLSFDPNSKTLMKRVGFDMKAIGQGKKYLFFLYSSGLGRNNGFSIDEVYCTKKEGISVAYTNIGVKAKPYTVISNNENFQISSNEKMSIDLLRVDGRVINSYRNLNYIYFDKNAISQSVYVVKITTASGCYRERLIK